MQGRSIDDNITQFNKKRAQEIFSIWISKPIYTKNAKISMFHTRIHESQLTCKEEA